MGKTVKIVRVSFGKRWNFQEDRVLENIVPKHNYCLFIVKTNVPSCSNFSFYQTFNGQTDNFQHRNGEFT